MRFQALLALTAAVALGLLAAPPAHATPLAPGAVVAPLAVVDPLTTPGNTILAHTSGTGTATLNGATLNVSYDAWVVKVGAGDLAVTDEGSQVVGNLDFVYQVTNLATSTTVVDSTSHFNFGGWGVGADYNAVAGEILPETSSRTANGQTVKFNYFSNGDVNPGQTLTLSVIETNAFAYKIGNYTFQDGVTVNVNAYAPAVPEPATIAAVLSGLPVLAFGLYRRHRKVA